MKVFIGWDPIDIQAYDKCVRSLRAHTKSRVDITPLKQWELRQKGIFWRPYHVDRDGQKWDDRDGKPFSTDFSFTRFCVPALENYDEDWVLFTDPDMLWRADIEELWSLIDPKMSVMCVKHQHEPPEKLKMGGLMQTRYRRKNWSSLMALNVHKCRDLTKYAVNNQPGAWLHGLLWAPDEEIGGLPEEWNWLEGWSDPEIDPKIVHFTRGTPDMKGCEDAAYAKEWWSA